MPEIGGIHNIVKRTKSSTLIPTPNADYERENGSIDAAKIQP